MRLERTGSNTNMQEQGRKDITDHRLEGREEEHRMINRILILNLEAVDFLLSDPAKRKKYDEIGANWQQYEHAGAGSEGHYGSPFGRQGRRTSHDQQDFDFEFGGSGFSIE